DARVLSPGETVLLVRGGHNPPLAQGTLKARRVVVGRGGKLSRDEESLPPRGEGRSGAISSDHTGGALRRVVVPFLRGRGLAVDDLGTEGSDPVDYPDMAALVADRVACGQADAGIVIDGAGIGSAIAANKVHGVRAAMASSETIARYSREHNGANVLTLGASLVTADEAKAIVSVWLTTPMREPRYIRRLTKIRDLEQG